MTTAQIIAELEKIANNSMGRTRSGVMNLIERIKYFELHNDETKLNNCKAEAELWISN